MNDTDINSFFSASIILKLKENNTEAVCQSPELAKTREGFLA